MGVLEKLLEEVNSLSSYLVHGIELGVCVLIYDFFMLSTSSPSF